MDFKKREYYVNNQAELDEALKAATEFGYTYEPNSHQIDGESSVYFLKLSEPKFQTMGKCDCCGALQSVSGIYSHGRECESCGELICVQYKKDDVLSFTFVDDKASFDRVNLKIHKVDKNTCTIWFSKDLVDGTDIFGGYAGSTPEHTAEKMEEFKNCYALAQDRDNDELYYMFYNAMNGMINPLTKINICDSRHIDGTPSGFKKCKVVKMYEGVEYPEYGYSEKDKIPVQETFTIYKDWLIKKNMVHFLHKVGINNSSDFYSGCGMSNIDVTKLSELRGLIEKHKGIEAANNFNTMLADIDMTASCIIKNLYRLEAVNYDWSKADKTEIRDIGMPSGMLKSMSRMLTMFPEFASVYEKFNKS